MNRITSAFKKSTPLWVTFLLVCIFNCRQLAAQVLLPSTFEVKSYAADGHTYTFYDMSREGNKIKAKYFANNPQRQFETWKQGKNILLVAAGTLSDNYTRSKPAGLCIDNGILVHDVFDTVWDGLVIVYNGGAQEGGIVVTDLDVNCVNYYSGDVKTSWCPRKMDDLADNAFKKWGQSVGLTLFQTQLIYSADQPADQQLNNLNYGEKNERRFLAICKKGNVVHHVIVNGPDILYLNQSAKYVKDILDHKGFTLLYLLNLAVGSSDFLIVRDGNKLQTIHNPNDPDVRISTLSNLIVYYTD